MPLTQLTSLRQELRSARFCQPAVALLLQPFPRLRADLLDAGFDQPGACSPEALAQWAAEPGAMCLGVDLVRNRWTFQGFWWPTWGAIGLIQWICKRFNHGIYAHELG